MGFEPTLRFPVNTLSKRAPSATRPPLLTNFAKAHAVLHKDARDARFCAFSHSATPPDRALARDTSYYIKARNTRLRPSHILPGGKIGGAVPHTARMNGHLVCAR